MRSTFRRAASLSESQLRALWRLRRSLIDIKPSVDPEADFAAFAEDFSWGIVWTLWEGADVVGFFLQRGLPLTWRGRRVLCLTPEYGFTAPHVRGRPELPAAVTLMTVACVLRYPLRPTYLAGAAYPPSFISLVRAIPPVWTVGDPDVPDWERSLLDHLGERIAKSHYRAADGTVFMRTLPTSRATPTTPEGRRLFEAYEQANPEWREGRGLFLLCPVTVGTLLRGMRTALARRSRRSGPRRPIVHR